MSSLIHDAAGAERLRASCTAPATASGHVRSPTSAIALIAAPASGITDFTGSPTTTAPTWGAAPLEIPMAQHGLVQQAS